MVVVSGRRLGRRRHRRRGRRVRAHARGHEHRLPGRPQRAARAQARAAVRRRAARARLRLHRQDARAAGGRRRARALDRRRHLPGGARGGNAGRLLRAARRPCAAEHARDGRARPAAPGQRHRRAARARARRASPTEPTAEGRSGASPTADPAAVEVVLSAPRRVRPIPRWRLRLVAIATQIALDGRARHLDDVDRRGHEPRGEGAARAPAHAREDRPAGRRGGRARALALPSRCSPTSWPNAKHPRLVRRRRRRAHAGSASPSCTPWATSCCPKCPSPRPLRWPARAAPCTSRRGRSACTTASTTCSRSSGLSVGQLVLARTDGATPVPGAMRLSATRRCLSARSAPATCSSSNSTARPPRWRARTDRLGALDPRGSRPSRSTR